jgi:hypothetical protein
MLLHLPQLPIIWLISNGQPNLQKETDILLVESTLDRSESPELRIRRDNAVTIAKKLIDDLNSQARYIFSAEKKAAEFMIPSRHQRPYRFMHNFVL